MKAKDISFVIYKKDNHDFDENKPKTSKPISFIELFNNEAQIDFTDGGYVMPNEIDIEEWDVRIIIKKGEIK